jgi:hypothetical protein
VHRDVATQRCPHPMVYRIVDDRESIAGVGELVVTRWGRRFRVRTGPNISDSGAAHAAESHEDRPVLGEFRAFYCDSHWFSVLSRRAR